MRGPGARPVSSMMRLPEISGAPARASTLRRRVRFGLAKGGVEARDRGSVPSRRDVAQPERPQDRPVRAGEEREHRRASQLGEPSGLQVMLDGKGDCLALPLRQVESPGDGVHDPDPGAFVAAIVVAARRLPVRGPFADIVEQHGQIDGRVGRRRGSQRGERVLPGVPFGVPLDRLRQPPEPPDFGEEQPEQSRTGP